MTGRMIQEAVAWAIVLILVSIAAIAAFSHPWKVAALIVGGLLLALTALGAYFVRCVRQHVGDRAERIAYFERMTDRPALVDDAKVCKRPVLRVIK